MKIKQDLLSTKEKIDMCFRDNLENQRVTVLKQSQQMFDDFVAKMDRMNKKFQAEVDDFFKEQSEILSKQILEVDKIVENLDTAYRNIQKTENKYAEENLFIRIQDIVADINVCNEDFRKIQNSFQTATLTFKKNDNLHKTVLKVCSLGTLETSLNKVDATLHVDDITFPKFQENPPHVMTPVRSKSLVHFRSFKDSY